MRLIILFFTFLILSSCDANSNHNPDLPTTICELINVVHKKYPFHVDSLSQTCGLYNQLVVTYFHKRPFRYTTTKWQDKEFICNNIKFKLLEDRTEFRNNRYKYFSLIGLEYLSDDGNCLVLRRKTDELFQRPEAGVGIDFSTSENYYMSKINGAWKIDSLVHDIQM